MRGRSRHIIRRDDDGNSTDRECFREAVGERLLRELLGVGFGVLCEEHNAAPAITVGEADAYVLIRVVPLGFWFLMGWEPGGLLLQRERRGTMC